MVEAPVEVEVVVAGDVYVLRTVVVVEEATLVVAVVVKVCSGVQTVGSPNSSTRLLPSSATYTFPEASTATPSG
jgi:hypothetical protein